MPHKPRVLIAEGQPVLRAGMRASLEAAGFHVETGTLDCESTVAATAVSRADVCLVDAALPGGFAVAVRSIRRHAPEVAVLVLADRPDSRQLLEAVRAGASGYLVKDLDAEQLPRAVSAVLLGEAVIPRRFVARLMEEIGVDAHVRAQVPQQRDPRLTNREQEVVDMLRAGWSTSRIADHLFVAPVTVRTHISAILAKLRLPDRNALLDEASAPSPN